MIIITCHFRSDFDTKSFGADFVLTSTFIFWNFLDLGIVDGRLWTLYSDTFSGIERRNKEGCQARTGSLNSIWK